MTQSDSVIVRRRSGKAISHSASVCKTDASWEVKTFGVACIALDSIVRSGHVLLSALAETWLYHVDSSR